MESCEIVLPPFKAGATYNLAGTVKGIAADATATCRLATIRDELVANLTVTLDAFVDLDTPRAMTVAAAASTAAWPPGDHRGDIRFQEADGTVIYTKTFTQPIKKAITPAP